MGKNFSGTGVDTNIIGRSRITGEPEMESPRIRYVSVLDLSEVLARQRPTGVGLVDFVTRRLVDKTYRKATYLNNLTTTFVTRAFTPLWFDTDREMLETMMFCLRSPARQLAADLDPQYPVPCGLLCIRSHPSGAGRYRTFRGPWAVAGTGLRRAGKPDLAHWPAPQELSGASRWTACMNADARHHASIRQ